MKEIKIFIFLLYVTLYGFSNTSVQEGQQMALKANHEGQHLKNFNPTSLPIEMSENSKESTFDNHERLINEKNHSKNHDPLFQQLKKSSDIPLEGVNPFNPLREGNKIVKRVVTKTVHKTCISSAEPYVVSFKEYLHIDLKLIPEIKAITKVYCTYHGWFDVKGPFPRKCELRDGIYDNVQKSVIRKRDIQVINERWIGENGGPLFETVSDPRFDVDSHIDLGNPQTRTIEAISDPDEKGVIHRENEVITRPFWEKTYTYRILPKPCFDCDQYKTSQCRCLSSQCVDSLTLPNGVSVCLKVKKEYACIDAYEIEEDGGDLSRANMIPKEQREDNKNMYCVLSQLEALKQMEQHQEGGAHISVFKGEEKRCSKNFGGSFKDCCNKSGGWGNKIGAATKCTVDEELLKKQRQENRCVALPGKITKRTLGIVTAHEYGFCCFPTPLARALQEGARQQLGLDFGSVHAAQCRGLRLDELSKINLSHMDLSDAFSSISQSTEKMKETLMKDLKQKQDVLQKSNSAENIQEKNQKFMHTQTLSNENARAEAQAMHIRQKRAAQ